MKNKILTTTFLIACFAADAYAFVAGDCKATDGWTLLEASTETVSKATSDLTADEITLGKPFSFKVALCAGDKKPERITANAIMPAHQHGMNYEPTVTFDETTQLYEVNDFLFHMPGLWEVSISTYQGDEAVHYTQNITVK